ncbi:hypothetical protein MTBBW1_1150002 [Desulfamplus magnetovallimortis]|uniref:Uncharacterized protein n=1 Tax=Desulfamplus magnetovallimortis TaxID=1246637 RepID=A0A1W1H5S6_9BACT|nr:hypothetical protein [Desulfamplus magnetovallimortis]SLM27829.1 hypothetical protein MTBBW1_1150002 [Desulfamplus magnetovallimortis]
MTEKRAEYKTANNNITHIIPVIYPFAANKAVWNEIHYSVRSLKRYLTEPHHIYIMGRIDPQIPGTEFIYHEDFPDLTTEQNNASKLDICVQAFEDTGFIWMNDDIYLLKPTKLYDIINTKPLCDMADYKTRGTRPWQQLLWNTRDLLAHNGIDPVFNFSTHTPQYYESKKLDDLDYVYGYPVFEGKVLFEMVYHNIYRPCPPEDVRYMCHPVLTKEKAGFYNHQQAATVAGIRERLKGCRYLNHDDNGLTPALQQVIMEIFAD